MFKLDEKAKRVTIETRASETAKTWLDHVIRHEAGERLDPKHFSAEHIKQQLTKDQEAFSGSLRDAKSAATGIGFDPSAFLNNPLQAALRKILGIEGTVQNKRKRTLSEHDGEYDHDRRWDVAPFQATQRIQSNKRIEVEVDFSFNAWTSQQQIQEYGIVAFNVVKALEVKGFQVDVSIVCNSANAYFKSGVPYTLAERHWVKRANEYQNAATFCRFFTPYFFRRCMFWEMSMAGKDLGLTVSSGLGSARPGAFEVRKGFVRLTPGKAEEIAKAQGKISVDDVKDIIKAAIG